MARENLGLWLILGGVAALLLLNGPCVDEASDWSHGPWYAADHGSTWHSSGVELRPPPEDAR